MKRNEVLWSNLLLMLKALRTKTPLPPKQGQQQVVVLGAIQILLL